MTALIAAYRSDRLTGAERAKLRDAGIAVPDRDEQADPAPLAEWCFYIETCAPLLGRERELLRWMLREPFEPHGLSNETHLSGGCVLEIGPQLQFRTPWSSNAGKICERIGLRSVARIERSRRILLPTGTSDERFATVATALHDRMTEAVYPRPLESFGQPREPEPTFRIPVIAEGMQALHEANRRFGLAMDEYDLEAYLELFAQRLRRDPTDVELFQLGQGNSEHSRHGFFKGRLVIDGRDLGTSLMEIVKEPWRRKPGASVIAFHDDSSAITGYEVPVLAPARPGSGCVQRTERRTYHPTLTAETHNHPTGVAPYPGAATGGGGRIRDNQCVGRGGLVVASAAAYCTANLHVPDYEQPWEQDGRRHPENLASPLEILIEASNGASDYGNRFGEPIVLGHARTVGIQTPSGYRAFFKPIMYSAGTGLIDARHIDKLEPQAGMRVVQIGGPAYRIGMGGGAASSLISGENAAELDFDSVQRGDPEMAQVTDRVIAACIAMGEQNPILSAHDYGAGGASNAVTEIVHPAGGVIDLAAMPSGDQSLSVRELWGCEAQERNAFLMDAEGYARFAAVCRREGCPVAVIGEISGDGRLVVRDGGDEHPVELPLEPILGKMPQRTLALTTVSQSLEPLALPPGLTVAGALARVLRLPAVASKRFLTTKVDRSVTGLVAQQQCTGSMQTPVADFAVLAHSHFGVTGTAIAQGERPLIGLISPAAQGRMTVAEAILNLAGAQVGALGDVRCSANWMWAAKLDGEGARLYEAASAMAATMVDLGIAIDGGKDSLSMAALAGGEVVPAPGQLVITPYTTMRDVRVKATPDVKRAGGRLVLIDLSGAHVRLGGSALAQVFGQLGDECPDMEDLGLLARAFEVIQQLLADGLIDSYHDRSDGGLIVTLAEMAIAGDRGLEVELAAGGSRLAELFCEEAGAVIEVAPDKLEAVRERLHAAAVPFSELGRVTALGERVRIGAGGRSILNIALHELRFAWEETALRIDALQANPACAAAEEHLLHEPLQHTPWRLTFTPAATPAALLGSPDAPAVCVLREEGSNGDREMRACLHQAGFNVFDVNMHDLQNGDANLDAFQGLVFPGGFSFGDVLDAGKGWAAAIRFSAGLAEQFEQFRAREDTFSLGICNGCQLMALLGWAPLHELADAQRPCFVTNASERFESRFVTVEIEPSPAIMLRDMAGSRLGVWVAHREGRLLVPSGRTLERILEDGLAPVRYLAPHGPTERYPYNPNGSPHGIAGVCSPDGRHLAMMPHPERVASALWQWPYLPNDFQELEASPWLRMFQSAREWCAAHPRG
ncbi:MAG: phosphoribosylformylglycinamidine synthase [Solirubrobacteraceae bacterium]